MEVWSLKILGSLCYHIGVEAPKQMMIESLPKLGVQTEDLVPPLVVVNPNDSSTSPDPRHITLDIRYSLLTNLFLILIADSMYNSRLQSLLSTSPSPGGTLLSSKAASSTPSVQAKALFIGLSAGLLAPVIGVGLGTALSTIGLTGASTFLAGSAGAVVITTRGVWIGARINAISRVADEGDEEGGVDVESGEEGVDWISGDLETTI
ncbi:hypothetical protein F5876DRAFT_71071 [Lentinula aff. lateritia]|uniref:Uncharacterized protein n=1 Tax=Lentinula aff. lateritia TaxID=2804960 RepID=A0ACC1TGU2_9AGAR|nr:hypothetical protein F5876DRAFT_71071 [Lentinula aff. lateritia]